MQDQVGMRNEIHWSKQDGEIDFSDVSHDSAALWGEAAPTLPLRGSLNCHYHRWEPQ